MTSSPDYIPVVVMQNCKTEFSQIFADPFNIYLQEFK